MMVILSQIEQGNNSLTGQPSLMKETRSATTSFCSAVDYIIFAANIRNKTYHLCHVRFRTDPRIFCHDVVGFFDRMCAGQAMPLYNTL